MRDSQRSKYAPALAKAFGISVEQLLDEAYDPASTSQKKSEIPAGEKWPFPISYERFLTIGSDIKDAVDMILIAAVEPTPISPDMYKKVTDAFSRATLAMLSDRPSQAGRRKGKRRAA
ncbi:MAG: hypothetical protein LBK01_00085 [Burkholderiaceae bacterium]|nr:hypothetical protein [Burkholderiaceae bacterium]